MGRISGIRYWADPTETDPDLELGVKIARAI